MTTEKINFHTAPTSALTEALADIGASNFYGRQAREIIQRPAGLNSWDDVTSFDFGPEHDFTVEDHGSLVMITQVSAAAKQWLYAHLPEDAPRWGIGYAVEHRYADDILNAMDEAGLMSEAEYSRAMEEMNQQRMQREC